MTEKVILVDQDDNQLGLMEKTEAHVSGALHRAFSIFVFNTEGKLLLQKRAEDKYHSGGKWTNTCCSHPRNGEETIYAAHRRLAEEMGMACELKYVFSFLYRAEVSEGVLEHEFDHVYFGISDEKPILDDNEASDYKYIDMEVLAEDISANPHLYTAWLKIAFDRIYTAYKEIIQK